MELSSAEFILAKQKIPNRTGPVRWILSHAGRYWYLFVMMTAGAFGNAALAAAVPVLSGMAFNLIQNKATQAFSLGWIAVLLIGSQILRGVVQFGRNFGAELIAQRIERDIREELYVSLIGKSMTFHNLQPVGDTMARATNDVREVNFMFSPGVNLVIGSANFLIMPLIFAPGYHPSLILVPALFIIFYFISLVQYLWELNPITTQVRSAFGVMSTRLSEALDGIETVKGLAQEISEINRFRENSNRFRAVLVKEGDVEARFVPMLLLAFAEAGGLLHALLLYQQNAIDIGAVVSYFGLIQMFAFPTFASLWAYSQVSLGLSGARRVLELINRENNLDQNSRGYAGAIKGEIEFRNVTFAYPNSSPTLVDVSFMVKPGQTVAIVGQTGAGKTTLVKLVNRTYDVQSGQVLVDGVDVRDWNLEKLRTGISMIEQDIFLFSRSVAENIAFGKPNADKAEIELAAQAAQATEFIDTFKDGYETVIGDRGVTLSGGQRQRVALARAFLTNPAILILDDSTSAIDSGTEDKIQRAIYSAARGRTTFLITHRISQIRWADVIVVLRKGRVAAVGNHTDLLASSEAYRRIFSE